MRVGVFLFSLSATLASVFSSSSNVLWANRVQSCLSVSPRLGFLSSFCSLFLSCWRLFSILVISSSFVLMFVVSNERPASFSARLPPPPPASPSTCLLLRLPPLVDLFLVQFCAQEGQLYIYLECLWDRLFVPQAPAVWQICVDICWCVSAQLPGSQRPRYVRM